jgi:hypothetical protein
MGQILTERMQIQARLQEKLIEFTDRLFSAIETVLEDARQRDIPGMGKSRRFAHPAGGGREGLQIYIGDWSVIFVPLPGYARPNALDQARIPGAQFKDLCARIGVFLTEEPTTRAFYDFIVFADGSWFAWGYGWPKQQADIESTDFSTLAGELLYSFSRDIFLTWTQRTETTLAASMDPKQRTYLFGLPGEDRQGL